MDLTPHRATANDLELVAALLAEGRRPLPEVRGGARWLPKRRFQNPWWPSSRPLPADDAWLIVLGCIDEVAVGACLTEVVRPDGDPVAGHP